MEKKTIGKKCPNNFFFREIYNIIRHQIKIKKGFQFQDQPEKKTKTD